MIEPNNKKFLEIYGQRLFNNDENFNYSEVVFYYKITRSISIILNNICLSLYIGKNKDLIYFMLICVLFYYTPLLIFSVVTSIEYLTEFKNNLVNKYRINRILIKNIVIND